MYIFQNALKNILRNRGRNIMIGIIIFAIILTTVVSLIINNTSNAVIESYKDRFASEVSITPDMEKVRSDAMANSTDGKVAMRVPEISSELLLSFASSEYLKESIATGSIGANSDEIVAMDQDDSDDVNGSSMASPGGATTGIGNMGFNMGGNGNFKLYGDYWQDFTDGTRSLKDDSVSTMPGADNECLISEELADENNIAVDDVLTFSATLSVPIPSDMDSSAFQDGGTVSINDIEYTLTKGKDDAFRASREVTYELKVVGIYLDITDEYANENMPKMAAMNRRNEVLTSLSTLIAQRATDETGVTVNVQYYLKTPELLSQFETEVRAKGLPDTFNVATNTDSYEKIVKPVEGLKSISITFMLVVIVLGAVILLLLCSLAIRERKYEIGVLRAVGMKKAKVAIGLWTEMLVITCICLVIGLGVGASVAQPVSDILLTSQVEAAKETADTNAGGMHMGGSSMTIRNGGMVIGGSNNSNAQPLSEMKITLGINTILEIIAISLVLTSVAGLFSISKITKYEPIKILMERN
jgi:putative ABC transport system permease protein